MEPAKIIGGGLAGCEAALQLSSAGYAVELIDVKPSRLLPAYQLKFYCELICNNSLGNINNQTPLGLLLAELDFLDSRLLAIAKECTVNDTRTISVDRQLFAERVTKVLYESGVACKNEYIQKLPSTDSPLLIATGALTNEVLAGEISQKYNLPNYYLLDASCPIVDGTSIDFSNHQLSQVSKDLFALRIPRVKFESFYEILRNSSLQPNHNIDFCDVLVQCKSLETIAKEGIEKLLSERFLPEGYNQATLLLRRESGLRNAFILVGCTTGLDHNAQRELFALLPAFGNIRFFRYGCQHRNTYFSTPGFVDSFFKIKNITTDVYLIGQLSGLDGYAPAIASGYVAAQHILNPKRKELPIDTMIGALSGYVSNVNIVDYQPMCASFSLIPKCDPLSVKAHSICALQAWLNS